MSTNEISLKRKLEFLFFAILHLEERKDGHSIGICIIFKKWSKGGHYTDIGFRFPELLKEINKALDKHGNNSVIDYSDNYMYEGRIRLLKRVIKQLLKERNND